MADSSDSETQAGVRKYNLCFMVCMLVGVVAAAIKLFGESLALSVMAIFYGVVVGAVSYLFCLCLMILLGFVLRGQFGKRVSDILCWTLLLVAPPLAWIVTSVTAARF